MEAHERSTVDAQPRGREPAAADAAGIERLGSLPVRPPVSPMLARLTRDLPGGDLAYEPKWDGFRAIAFRAGAEVDIRSRHDRPLARYFPEVVAALRNLSGDAVLDGEITLLGPKPFDFGVLMSRLHPAASRVTRLAVEDPATFVAFDALATGHDDLRRAPFVERRHRLEAIVGEGSAGMGLTPMTRDAAVARRWLDAFHGGGIDGVVAKPLDGPYEPGRRAMIKVKRVRTADCVVAGMRMLPGGSGVSSLLLGLYDGTGALRHVGVVTQVSRATRQALATELAPDRVDIEAHPWRDGFTIERSPLGRLLGSASRWTPEMALDWVPLAPRRVLEVAYDQVDGARFRHPARFVRWRPDRDPASCRIEQVTDPGVDGTARSHLVA
jgi:ATP-dependent DNA ligase